MTPELDFEALQRLNKDLLQAARTLSQRESRYLVTRYYQVQAERERMASQLRAAGEFGEPNMLLQWEFEQARRHEDNIKSALHEMARSKIPGQWMLSIMGIGPVIAAGFLAHIDITRSRYAGNLWSFFGLVSTQEWLGEERARKLVNEVVPEKHRGDCRQYIDECAVRVNRKPENVLHVIEMLMNVKKKLTDEDGLEVDGGDVQHDGPTKRITREWLIKGLAMRPWNAAGKVLCWKLGDSFVKISNNPNDTMYGKLYRRRKAELIVKNETGGFKQLAEDTLAKRNIQEKKTLERYNKGMLPDGRIDYGARRYAVKLFIAHLHHVLHEDHYGTPPPLPYAIAQLGHGDYVPPPNWPMEEAAPKRRMKRAA